MFISTKVKLPPPCGEVLVIRPVAAHNRIVFRPVMEYISTHPQECVDDMGILYWCHITMPDDVPVHSFPVDKAPNL